MSAASRHDDGGANAPPPPLPEELHEAVLRNTAFRRVLHTDRRVPGAHTQLVAMCVRDDTGTEAHARTAQYFLVKDGRGTLELARRATARDVAERDRCVLQRASDDDGGGGGGDVLVRVTHSVPVQPGSAWLVEPGTYHNVRAEPRRGAPPLRLLTVYYPPHHPDTRVDTTHEAARARERAAATSR